MTGVQTCALPILHRDQREAGYGLAIADSVNQRIRVVAAGTGTFYGQPMTVRDIYTVAGGGTGGLGDGGPATSALLGNPQDAVATGSGGLLIADGTRRVRQVTG